MAKFDTKNSMVVAFGISATLSGTTPSKGNIVDLKDVESATFVLQTGVVTDAGDANGFVTEIQESDTTADGAFTAVANANLVGLETALTVTLDTADSVAVGAIGYIGTKRYVRAVVTGSTGTNAVVNGVWILQRPRVAPVTNAAANIAAT